MEVPATPASVTVQRRIEWADTDAAGHYHNLTVFRLLEHAEAVLHDRIGIVFDTFGRTPRVRVSAEFSRSLHFHDVAETTIRVARLGHTSITYEFEVGTGGEPAAVGEVVAVLLDKAEGRPTPWPDEWRRLLLEGGPQRPERVV
jgi:acyl-CoA thioesterase FadM